MIYNYTLKIGSYIPKSVYYCFFLQYRNWFSIAAQSRTLSHKSSSVRQIPRLYNDSPEYESFQSPTESLDPFFLVKTSNVRVLDEFISILMPIRSSGHQMIAVRFNLNEISGPIRLSTWCMQLPKKYRKSNCQSWMKV